MISNKKIKILEIWENNPFANFTLSEIMTLLKKRTKTWIFNSLKLLVNYEILNSKRKGNLDIYSLNLHNPISIQLLEHIETQKNLNFPRLDIISEIIERIAIKNYSLIIFGSYAENKQTKNSDLDICFLIENKRIEQKIKPYVNEIKLNFPIKIDEHYITFEEFIKLLLRDEENLGKQIFRKHKIFYNPDIYYQLLKQAQKNGFRP